MLKQRLLTAAILVPLTVFCVLKVPTEVLALLLAVIILAGAWEWGGLLKLETLPRLVFAVFMLAGMLMAFFVLLNQPQILSPLLAFASLLWLVLIVAVTAAQCRGHLVAGLSRVQYLPLGFLLFVLAWLSALYLHAIAGYGPSLLLYVMALVWLVDAAAYFSGRRWGKDKLASHISPGKTWQGFYGALIVGLLFALAGGWYFGYSVSHYVIFVLLSLVVIVFSVFGDLFESWVKRRAGVKDSGHLLPGHGGALDRIDSLLAALPVMAFGLSIFGIV